jgi:monoamine oxidase
MINRRSLLAGVAGLPMMARSAQSADYDSVIVGAGLAGLSAARTLQSHGLSVVVLEARERIGGRARTCVGPMNLPFDLGALWFHSAEHNPLAALAKSRGVPLESSDFGDIELRRGGSVDTLNVANEIDRGESRIRREALLNVLFRIDRPLSDFATDPASTLAVEAEALQCAAPATNLSIIDVAGLDDGANVVPAGGMGSFVVSLGGGLRVHLNCQVERIDLSGVVRISGGFGSITARSCIVTIPTSLLATESIKFTPSLPHPIMQHFVDLPMGLMLKVGLGLTEPMTGIREFTVVDTSGSAVVRIAHAQRLATVITSGETAQSVSAGGAVAKSQFARDLFRAAFGSSAPLAIDGDVSSAWDSDPYALGSYAHAPPGKHRARKVYDMDVDERLFFAGEAGGREYAMTVGGAWLSGERAASRAMKALRHG